MKGKWPMLDSDTFPAWSDRLEKRIRRCIMMLVVLLIVSQAAMQSPIVRSWLSATDRAEGIELDRGPG